MEIIAEIGQNHNGDMGQAKELIQSAAENGADVAKFQLYDAKALFPKEGNPWYEYNCKTELSRDQLEELFEECQRVGIEFMTSVFDVERIDWTEALGVNRYKIASRSIKDDALIQAFIKTDKQIIASLGMWDGDAFPVINTKIGVQYLYCVSKYPTDLEDLHLSEVSFDRYAGFSDHSIGIVASIAACARGAGILEKHFTLDKTLYGPDHEGSMNPTELANISKFRDEFERCL